MRRASNVMGANAMDWCWRLGTALAVAAALVFTPAIAQAAFTGSARDVLTASTLTLSAPLQRSGGIQCSKNASGTRATVQLSSVIEAVPRANAYTLTVTSPTRTTTTVAYDGNRTALYTAAGNPTDLRGTWTYSIRADYQVPGQGTTWFGVPRAGSYRATC